MVTGGGGGGGGGEGGGELSFVVPGKWRLGGLDPLQYIVRAIYMAINNGQIENYIALTVGEMKSKDCFLGCTCHIIYCVCNWILGTLTEPESKPKSSTISTNAAKLPVNLGGKEEEGEEGEEEKEASTHVHAVLGAAAQACDLLLFVFACAKNDVEVLALGDGGAEAIEQILGTFTTTTIPIPLSFSYDTPIPPSLLLL